MQQLEAAAREAAQWNAAALRSARLGWDVAPRRCPQAAIGCLAYHRIRPLLRLIGLGAEPDDQREFLFPALVDALGSAGTTVLVSGSTDSAMAAMVVEAGAKAEREPVITVLDRCATPLLVNEVFSEATGNAVTTVQSDILGYEASGLFDVIVTHSFIGQIAPADRPSLMAKWAAVLKPGGRAVTVARLRPADETRSYSGAAAERLVAEVRRRAGALSREIGVSLEQLAAGARDYANQRPASFPLHSLEELTDLLERAGFRMLHAERRETAARITGIDGPGLPRAGIYAEIVAERR